jgi:hypothetical protein
VRQVIELQFDQQWLPQSSKSAAAAPVWRPLVCPSRQLSSPDAEGCALRDAIVPSGIERSPCCRTSWRPDCRTCSIQGWIDHEI